MKTIKNMVGLGSLELHIQASLDGEKVLDQKAESLINGFTNILCAKMRSGHPNTNSQTIESQLTVTAATNASPIEITTSSSHSLNTGDYVYIWGALGNTAANGLHQVTYAGSTKLQLDGTTGNGTYTPSSGKCYTIDDENYLDISESELGKISNTGSDIKQGVVVGTSTQAVAMNNGYLVNPIINGTGSGQLQLGTTTVDVPVVSGSDIYVNITRNFANGSGAGIIVNEIGLMFQIDDNGYALGARDVVTPITIPKGVTLTVNYQIKSTLSATGGFTLNFFNMLYSIFTNSTRSLTNINSASATVYPLSSLALAVGGGGGDVQLNGSTYKCDQFGLVVGTDTSTTSSGTVALGAHIRDGETTGTLKYYGTRVSEVVYESGYSSIFIERVFENVSGGEITINESGLYANGASSTVQQYWNTPFCIERTKLSSPLVLSNGEYGKVIYEIRIAL